MSENDSLEKLIYGGTFEIPEYQRAYSWEEAPWAQFIIEAVMESWSLDNI
jgi:uncharacterized protein with ParB-like and HNH nuclease domain